MATVNNTVDKTEFWIYMTILAIMLAPATIVILSSELTMTGEPMVTALLGSISLLVTRCLEDK